LSAQGLLLARAVVRKMVVVLTAVAVELAAQGQ